MKVIKVKHSPFYDVFVGDGWHNHARVYAHKGKFSFVGRDNTKLSHSQVQSLKIKLLMEAI